MFSCVLSCEEETALSIIDPTSALVELNNARRQKGRKNTGLLDIAEEQLPSLEVSNPLNLVFLLLFLVKDSNCFYLSGNFRCIVKIFNCVDIPPC